VNAQWIRNSARFAHYRQRGDIDNIDNETLGSDPKLNDNFDNKTLGSAPKLTYFDNQTLGGDPKLTSGTSGLCTGGPVVNESASVPTLQASCSGGASSSAHPKSGNVHKDLPYATASMAAQALSSQVGDGDGFTFSRKKKKKKGRA
jgi:hypothetical protein